MVKKLVVVQGTLNKWGFDFKKKSTKITGKLPKITLTLRKTKMRSLFSGRQYYALMRLLVAGMLLMTLWIVAYVHTYNIDLIQLIGTPLQLIGPVPVTQASRTQWPTATVGFLARFSLLNAYVGLSDHYDSKPQRCPSFLMFHARESSTSAGPFALLFIAQLMQ